MPTTSDDPEIKEPDFTQRWFLYLSATLLLPVLYLVGNHTSNVPLIAGLWSVARASFVLLILGYIGIARRRELKIRRIAGLEALDEALGRATEMGKPVLFIHGLPQVLLEP